MAKTTEQILAELKSDFTELSGSEVNDASDTGIKLRALAAQLCALHLNLDYLERQMFPNTAIDEALDGHAAARGLKRREGFKSYGTLRFSLPSALYYSLLIPAGTLCSTGGDKPKRFLTIAAATIAVGALYADVPAEAESCGETCNVSPGEITEIINPPYAALKVTNTAAFFGGAETEPDEDLRARVLDSYFEQRTSSNAAYYKEIAYRRKGVGSVFVAPRARGRGTVDIYVAGYGGTVSSDVIADIQSEVNDEKEINVDARVYAATIKDYTVALQILTKENFAFDSVAEDVRKAVLSHFKTAEVGKYVYLSGIMSAVCAVNGVQNVKITAPTADIKLLESAIPRLSSLSVTPMG